MTFKLRFFKCNKVVSFDEFYFLYVTTIENDCCVRTGVGKLRQHLLDVTIITLKLVPNLIRLKESFIAKHLDFLKKKSAEFFFKL